MKKEQIPIFVVITGFSILFIFVAFIISTDDIYRSLMWSIILSVLIGWIYTKIEYRVSRKYKRERVIKRQSLRRDVTRMIYKEFIGLLDSFKPFHEIKDDINFYISCYPKRDLAHWPPFSAKYKMEMDHMMEFPSIYTLKDADGNPYDKTKDPLYKDDADPEDWYNARLEYLGRHKPDYYSDDDNDDDDEYDDINRGKKNKSLSQAASDGFFMGIGFGIGNSIFGGSGSNSSSS